MRLEVKVPQKDWVGEFTRRHPELVVENLNITAVAGGDLLGEYEIYGPPVDWTSELASSPDVVEVDSLSVGPDLGRYRLQSRKTALLDLTKGLGLIARYPRTIQNGILECEVIARLSRLRRMVERYTEAGFEPHLVSLRRNTLRSAKLSLTPIQRALFRQALALGYFEVPRRITLTRLADKVSRNKSSVSTTLATVERKLAEFAVTAGA
jgi:predicted DNA binding protein